MRKISYAISVVASSLFITLSTQAADRTVIQNKGSDTLVNVAQAWAEAMVVSMPMWRLPYPVADRVPVSLP
jgi:ABC-type phosphate transport system substrate-binding protein